MSDVSGGRRDYDPDSPLFEALEQRVLRALEKGLGDTRHTMRDELAPIAAKVETIMLQGRDTTVTLANLVTDVAEMKPELYSHRDRLDALERQERADQAVAKALEKNRLQQVANRTQIRTWAITIIGFLLASSTAIVIALLSHPH